MNDVVNLRRFRKKKAHAEKEAQAEQNRAKFGRTKAERQRDACEKASLAKHVDLHKREGE